MFDITLLPTYSERTGVATPASALQFRKACSGFRRGRFFFHGVTAGELMQSGD